MASLRSISSGLAGRPVRVPGMTRLQLRPDERHFIEEQALGIFTDMVNSGASLQQTLAAIYLSGLSAGREAAQ